MAFLYVPGLAGSTANSSLCYCSCHEQVGLGTVRKRKGVTATVRESGDEPSRDSGLPWGETEAGSNDDAGIRHQTAGSGSKESMGREQSSVEGGRGWLFSETFAPVGKVWASEKMRNVRLNKSKTIRMGEHERPIRRTERLQASMQELPRETRQRNQEHNENVACTSCRCARVSGASTSESISQCPPLEPSLMWRGKPMRPQSWRLAWKRGILTPLLSTLTCELSMRQRGVESWISSLRDSRASRSASPESASTRTTSGTCGPRFSGSLANASQLSFSWRTSQFERLSSRGETFEDWASTCRAPSRVPPPSWVRDILGAASSFLPTVITKTAGEDKKTNRGGKDLDQRLIAATNNRFPRLRDRLLLTTSTGHGTNHGGAAGRTGPVRPSLDRLLATPTNKGDYNRKGLSERSGDGIRTQLLASPRVGVHGEPGSGPRHPQLKAQLLATPRVCGSGNHPQSRHRTVDDQIGGQVNPRWKEWFCGFRIGWTEIELSEIASSHNKPPSRSGA